MSETTITLQPANQLAGAAAAADRDAKIVEMWLHGLSPHTQRAYQRDSTAFLAYVKKPLRFVTLEDAQAFSKHLNTLKLVAGSKHRVLSGVKSLFAFAHGLGYLPYDVTRVLRLPAMKDKLNERILEEADVAKLIAGAGSPRDRAMLQLLYRAGLRVSEMTALKWTDLRARGRAGQVTVFGKGSKTRTVLLQETLWADLQSLRGTAADDAPVFLSRRRGHLHPSQVLRTIKAAAKRAGITSRVSPHWLRHCHASHALDHGAPIHLVQATLGHTSVATTSRYLHARPAESSSSFLPS